MPFDEAIAERQIGETSTHRERADTFIRPPTMPHFSLDRTIGERQRQHTIAGGVRTDSGAAGRALDEEAEALDRHDDGLTQAGISL